MIRGVTMRSMSMAALGVLLLAGFSGCGTLSQCSTAEPSEALERLAASDEVSERDADALRSPAQGLGYAEGLAALMPQPFAAPVVAPVEAGQKSTKAPSSGDRTNPAVQRAAYDEEVVVDDEPALIDGRRAATMPTMRGLARRVPYMAGDEPPIPTQDEIVGECEIGDAIIEIPCDEIDVTDAEPDIRDTIVGPTPLPFRMQGPWKPEGFGDPWPEDEYLRDGGDLEPRTLVNDDWSVLGLGSEDTVVHFDTIDGDVRVQPSNRVHLYAPKFCAVRTVVAANADLQIDAPRGYEMQKPYGLLREAELARHSKQHEQVERHVGTKQPSVHRLRQRRIELSSRLGPEEFRDAFLPFENLSVLRRGLIEQTEKARLAAGIQAAVTWTGDQAVQAIVDEQAASEVVLDRHVGTTFRYDDLPGNPRLRVIKVASTQFAHPGDTVDFTIRYDNVGDETLGNVTVLDHLTTRLEYVPDSAQSSVTANFSTEPSNNGSSVLRWEIEPALKLGEGGIVRFRCLVR